jgi:hypothetical protein
MPKLRFNAVENEFNLEPTDTEIIAVGSGTYVPYTGAGADVNLGTHSLTTSGTIQSGALVDSASHASVTPNSKTLNAYAQNTVTTTSFVGTTTSAASGYAVGTSITYHLWSYLLVGGIDGATRTKVYSPTYTTLTSTDAVNNPFSVTLKARFDNLIDGVVITRTSDSKSIDIPVTDTITGVGYTDNNSAWLPNIDTSNIATQANVEDWSKGQAHIGSLYTNEIVFKNLSFPDVRIRIYLDSNQRPHTGFFQAEAFVVSPNGTIIFDRGGNSFTISADITDLANPWMNLAGGASGLNSGRLGAAHLGNPDFTSIIQGRMLDSQEAYTSIFTLDDSTYTFVNGDGYFFMIGGYRMWDSTFSFPVMSILSDGRTIIDPLGTYTDDTTSALQVNGEVSFPAIDSGVGPPATHNTTGKLYTDTATGLVYVQ